MNFRARLKPPWPKLSTSSVSSSCTVATSLAGQTYSSRHCIVARFQKRSVTLSPYCCSTKLRFQDISTKRVLPCLRGGIVSSYRRHIGSRVPDEDHLKKVGKVCRRSGCACYSLLQVLDHHQTDRGHRLVICKKLVVVIGVIVFLMTVCH